MKTLGVIPARGGSKGIPQKNIKELAGKPLIDYTIEASLKSDIDRVIVSTDSKEIEKVAIQHDIEVVRRPPELAEDRTPTLPVLHNVIDALEEKFDAVVTLQPTSPFRTSNHINEALDMMENNPQADSLVSVVEIPHNMAPQSAMRVNREGLLIDYLSENTQVLRRQDKQVFYARNGAAIYITRMGSIKSYIFGGKIIPYKMRAFESLDIDTLEDFNMAELIMKNKGLL